MSMPSPQLLLTIRLAPVPVPVPVPAPAIAGDPDDDEGGAAPRPSCLSCGAALDLHQPDPARPHRLLGTCPDCGSWFVLESREEGGEEGDLGEAPASYLFELPACTTPTYPVARTA